MKNLFKGLSVILCAILILACAPAVFPVSADASGTAAAEKLLYEGILNHDETIDVSECGITVEECQAMLAGFFDSYPYVFVADRLRTSFSYSPADNIVTLIRPTYLFDENAAAKALDLVEKSLDAIISKVRSSWSVPEKLLFLHDYIALNFEYDTTYESPDVYTFLTKKAGTCNAYCMTLMALCDKLGIPSVLVSSQQMYHAWLRVQIDGQWYNIDVTHDDALPDRFGKVAHEQFLVSDDKISDKDFYDRHYAFETGFCTSKKYDGAFWTESASNVVWLDGKWYYSSAGAALIKTGSFSTLSGTTVHEFDTLWSTPGGYWPGSYSGLIAENGKLLYNTENAIVELDPSSGETRNVFTLESGQIYGLYKDASDTLLYVKAGDPNGTNQSKNAFTVPVAYTVRFMSEGRVFASYKVSKGDAIPCPESEPVKRSDDVARYEFSRWNGYSSGLKATADADFEAVFNTIPFTTAPKTSGTPATTKNSATGAPSTTAPASTAPATSASAPTLPASTAPESTAPASSAALTEAPTEPASSATAPESTRDDSSPNPPDVSYSGEAEVTHNLPVRTDPAPTGSASGQDPAVTTAKTTGVSGRPDPEPTDNNMIPWIIAGAGGVLVVSFIIVLEKIILPKRRKKDDDQTK